MRRPLFATALALSIACQPAVPAPDAERPAGLRATFVLANAGGLLALDERCRPIGRVIELPSTSAPATPGLRPDGEAIAFALTGQPSPTTGFGSDIYEVGLDGTGLRPLVEHEAENVFYASPRYDPSGEVIYVHRRSAVVEEGSFIRSEDLIMRVDLRTGERRTVVSDAADPALSPDGTTLTYVRLRDGQPESLWRIDTAEGATPEPFLASGDTWFWIQTPRYSPSGDRIVFSAAGRASGLRGSAKLAHLVHLGIPSDLFIAPADGSALEVVGTTGDDVQPVWSPDGTQIGYVGVGVFAILTLESGRVDVCAEGEQFFFGEALWLRERGP